MKNIFTPEVNQEVIERINRLTTETKPQWGKMNISQMLAHCNITYEMAYENKHSKPKGIMKLILKFFVKGIVVGEKPYKRNSQTAAVFIINTEKDFEVEKERLINYINKTHTLGKAHFEQRASLSFGKLSSTEWNNMFFKHLDHHLTQFGV
ncbi:MAG: hypothetical protein ACI905_000196 [Roseivirga sp.]|jgi:hypothetical protein